MIDELYYELLREAQVGALRRTITTFKEALIVQVSDSHWCLSRSGDCPLCALFFSAFDGIQCDNCPIRPSVSGIGCMYPVRDQFPRVKCCVGDVTATSKDEAEEVRRWCITYLQKLADKLEKRKEESQNDDRPNSVAG